MDTRRISGELMKTTLERDSYFINVDLDVYSRANLDAVVKAFGGHVFVLHCGREGRRFGAHLELAGLSLGTPDAVIVRFVRLINRLPPEPRGLWNRATSRIFNIGVQAGLQPLSLELLVKPATVAGISGVGAGLALTIYSPAVTTPVDPSESAAKRRAQPPNPALQRTRFARR